MAEAGVPLDPTEAAALFLAGTTMALVATPAESFVAVNWMGALSFVTEIPFGEDPVAFFTANPAIIYVPPAPGAAVSAAISASTPASLVKSFAMAVDLPLGLSVNLVVTYKDGNGNVVRAPGPVAWVSSDPGVATVTPGQSDDAQANAASVAEGATTITATSSGISASIDITVAAGAAATAEIAAGTPSTLPG
jgi:hypothetical protein